MAYYKYKIHNNGTSIMQGSYESMSGPRYNYLAFPGQVTTLYDCALEGSFRHNDPNYFLMFGSLVIDTSAFPCVVIPPPIGCDLEITDIVTTPANQVGGGYDGTATIIATGTGILEYSIDKMFYQDSNLFVGLSPGNRVGYVRRKGTGNCLDYQSFTIPTPIPQLIATVTNVKHASTVGGADGEVMVTIAAGSGQYTVTFAIDGLIINLNSGSQVQSMVKTGLIAGDYAIEVKDLVSGEIVPLSALVFNPVVVPPVIDNGTFFEVPMMNSFHYVQEKLHLPQTPDNRLLVNQYYPGFRKTNYFQPVVKEDFYVTQFNTDYRYSRAELFKYGTTTLVKTFPEAVLREANLGVTEDFAIRITNHTVANQSRLYFGSGPPPIPISVGQAFEILNNANGFNGVYNAIGVDVDTNLGYEYIVINKLWDLDQSISSIVGTGRFDVTYLDFNVWEVQHTFLDVPNGCYYIKITVFDATSSRVAYSEPLDIRVAHPKTLELRYRNIDNAFGMTFNYGYIGLIRIPALLGHKRSPGGERTTSRNSDFSLVKVSAKKTRVFDLELFMLPPYKHEKLSIVFDLDVWTINNVQYQTTESYETPAYIDRFLLANSKIRIEQVQWHDKYNSDDVSSIADGGFIIANGGFLKR